MYDKYMETKKYDVLIIGGGISGSILAQQIKNKKVALVEKENKLLKKCLATGNGRCNISNLELNSKFYNTDKINSLIEEKSNFLNEFKNLGLDFYYEEDRVYPMSETSSGFVEFITNLIKHNKNVDVYLNEKINKISDKVAIGTNYNFEFKTLVYAIGSDSLVSEKIDRNILNNLKFKEFNPSLLPIITNKDYLKNLKGVRVKCKFSLFSDDNLIYQESGGILFKDNGLSGIPALQASAYLARNFKNLKVKLDLIENIDEKRYESIKKVNKDFVGILPKNLIENVRKFQKDKKISEFKALKNFEFKIYENKDFKNSQVCSGGLILDQFDLNSLCLKENKNIFAIGEILDVDGLCGGYNISFAIMSAMKVGDIINGKNK